MECTPWSMCERGGGGVGCREIYLQKLWGCIRGRAVAGLVTLDNPSVAPSRKDLTFSLSLPLLYICIV